MMILDGFDEQVFALAFSPDGRMLASAGDSGRIRIWDTVDGRLAREIDTRRDCCQFLAYSPTGRELLSHGVILWDLDTGISREPQVEREWLWPLATAFSPAGGLRVLQSVHLDLPRRTRVESSVVVRDLESPRPLALLSFIGTLRRTAFAPGGRKVVLGMVGPDALIWHLDAAPPVAVHDPEATAPSPPGVVACRVPGSSRKARGAPRFVDMLSFSADGGRCFGVYESKVVGWDASDGRALAAFRVDRRQPTALAVAPGGDLLAVRSPEGVWQFDTEGRLVSAHDPGIGDVSTLRYAPDGLRLAAGGRGAVAIWDVDA